MPVPNVWTSLRFFFLRYKVGTCFSHPFQQANSFKPLLCYQPSNPQQNARCLAHSLRSQHRSYLTQLKAGVLLTAVATSGFILLRPTQSHVENSVWVSGIQMSQAEANQILSADQKPFIPKNAVDSDLIESSSTTHRFALFQNNVQSKAINLSQTTFATRLKGTVQRSGQQVYSLKATAGQTLNVTLQGDAVTMVILQPDHQQLNTNLPSAQGWKGTLSLSGNYLIQVQGTGVYTLDIQLIPTL